MTLWAVLLFCAAAAETPVIPSERQRAIQLQHLAAQVAESEAIDAKLEEALAGLERLANNASATDTNGTANLAALRHQATALECSLGQLIETLTLEEESWRPANRRALVAGSCGGFGNGFTSSTIMRWRGAGSVRS
ncbi:unnamed protein product [Effrenium voratum]|nr:unnamed protein product [Effrenium voratum]